MGIFRYPRIRINPNFVDFGSRLYFNDRGAAQNTACSQANRSGILQKVKMYNTTFVLTFTTIAIL